MRMDHPIFHTPHEVKLTLEDRATPSEYFQHPKGEQLAPTLPMWRVQTEGYQEGKGQLIGVVSRDAGFFDSPDVEWISSGVNSKGPEAIAIGRHGNFLHWGFAASPTYLTPEAKLVLVNALHYIAGFDHKAPIARKVQGVVLREQVLQALDSITDAGYAKVLARYDAIRKDQAERQAAVRARIEAGEDVPESERQILAWEDVQNPGRLDAVRRFVSAAVWAELGETPEALDAYLRAHLPYLHPSGEWYELAVDTDLEDFGLGNNDPALLERAVAGWEADEDAERCQTLLDRYTLQRFATVAEWRAWLDANRDRLFFCETAGYKWLVDEPGSQPMASPLPSLQPTPKAPLASRLTVQAGEDGYWITVEATLLKGWHAYDQVPEDSAYIPLSLELELPAGLQAGPWQRPASHPDQVDPTLQIFEGSLAFRCEVRGYEPAQGPVELTCKLRYQVCDERMCLAPKIETLTTTLGRP